MSMLGASPGIFAAASAGTAGPISALIAGMNTNPYLIGLMMLLMNLGGRFLALEVTKGQEAFLSHPFVRRGLIFVVLFIATRNLVTAFWLWLLIIMSLGYLFNENSALCVLGRRGFEGSKCAQPMGPAPPKPTDQEMGIYKMLEGKVKSWEAFQDMGSLDPTATAPVTGGVSQQPLIVATGQAANLDAGKSVEELKKLKVEDNSLSTKFGAQSQEFLVKAAVKQAALAGQSVTDAL
jgi:hypothetical protein